MKRLLPLFLLLLSVPAFATLANPAATITSASYVSSADGISQQFWNIGTTPTFLRATNILFTPDNIQGVIFSAATPHPVCYTLDGSDPTPITHGTCPSNATTFTYGSSSPLLVNGSVTIKYIATDSTDNSAVLTSAVTIAPFGVYDGSSIYAYTPAVVLSGTYNGNLIYTTNSSTPTANSDCTASNGTAATNGTTIAPTNGEVVKIIGCLSGTTSSISTATYTTRSQVSWFIRADGGTRYDTVNDTGGQCDGQSDLAAAGAVSHHCAFKDFRYMYDDDSGVTHYPVGVWLMAGGETVLIRGCTALAGQTNPSNPNCRIGQDENNGNSSSNWWCYYNNIGTAGCYNPTVPPGIIGQHTRILGQNYAACNTGGATNPKTYEANLTQLFGGMNTALDINLAGARYADLECLELTSHNSTCTGFGSPSYPAACSTNPPVSDYAQNGVQTDYNTSNVLLQDIYIHGTAHAGIAGPIGGVATLTRVFIGFNGFVGWNFDDGNNTPDAPGSQILASYVQMEGNGCYEQYPIVNAFPARACYDSVSNGFGDSWSGQDTILDTFTCDHCTTIYNTKDGWIGPHTLILHQSVTNSTWFGNMGTQYKNGEAVGGDFLFQNNLAVGNCARMSTTLVGAAQNFNQTTALGGSYLTNYCRAGGAAFALSTSPGAYAHFFGNTVIGAWDTIFQYDCGPQPGGLGTCGSVPLLFKDNNFLGYTDPAGSGSAPGLYYYLASGLAVTADHNNEFGIRNGDTCGVNNITCVDPLMVSEPAQTWPGSEAALDVFNPFAGSGNSFYPTSGSPLLGAGTTIAGLTTDYYGTTRPSPPSLSGVELGGSPPPTSVIISVTIRGATIQ